MVLSTKLGFKNFGSNILWVLEDFVGKKEIIIPHDKILMMGQTSEVGGGVGWGCGVA